MTERIGLEAQFGLGQFNRGVSQYNSAISGMNRNTSSVSGSISSALGSIGNAIGGVATVAGGIIAANVFGKLASGVQNFVSSGLDAVSNAQMLEASLGSLLTANNMYEKSTTTTTVAIQKSSAEMAKNAQRVTDLTLKRDTLSARIQEQKERIRQMTEEWTSEGLATQTAKARLAEMENQLTKTDAEISNLSGSQTEYADVSKTTFEQVMNMAEAQGLAAKQSQELLREIDRIAIVSPFEQEQVQQVAKYAVAAGLGVKETSAFTASFLDMSAAVGIGSQELGFAADQLLQVKKIGKLTTIDLRQLRRLGIDLEKIIGVEMGMSIEEFNTEAEKSDKIFDDLFQAVTDFSSNTFAGTTEKMATSIEGLRSTFGDIFRIGARNILRPLVDAVSPTISEMLNKMADFFSGPRATAIGEKLTSVLMSSIRMLKGIGVFDFIQNSFSKLITLGGRVSEIVGKISGAFERFGIRGASISILGMLGFDSSQISSIMDFADRISEIINSVISGFQEGGISGAFTNLFTSLQVEIPTIINDIATLIGEAIAQVWPVVEEQLFIWRDNFMKWATDIYPQIPSILTEVVGGIAEFLKTNWPTISDSLSEWTDMFWDWATEVAANAGQGLAAIGAALIAWATSGEGQSSADDLGHQLGIAIFDSLDLMSQNQEGLNNVMFNLIKGLGVAAAATAGTLVIVGGQIVAGIISGIAEKMGVDLEPATFSELSGILSGIGDNIITIASLIGRNIVVGVLNGINSGIADINSSVTGIADNIVTIFKSVLGISSPSTVFMEFGVSLIDGLIVGIQSSVGRIGEVLSGLFSGDLLSSIMPEGGFGSLLGSLFGGGGKTGTEQPAQPGTQPGMEGGPFAGILSSIQQLLPLIQQAQANITTFTTTIQTAFSTMGTAINKQLSILSEALTTTFGSGLSESVSTLSTTIGVIRSIVAISMEEMASSLLSASLNWEGGWMTITSATVSASGQVSSIVSSMMSTIQNILKLENFRKIGMWIIKGLVKGIEENEDKVREALMDVIRRAMEAIKKELGISSPAKATITIGQQITQGLIVGAKNNTGQLKEEYAAIAKAGLAAFNKIVKKGELVIDRSDNIESKSTRDKIRRNAGDFRGRIQEFISKGLESGQGVFGINEMTAAINNAIREGDEGVEAFSGKLVQNSREIAKQIFDSVEDDVKKVLTRINNDIAVKLAQGAGQFIQLGNTAIKHFVDPIKKAIDEINETKIALPVSEDFLKQLNELQTLQARQGFGEILSISELEKMEKLQSAINSIDGVREIADMNKELNQLTAKSEMLRSVGSRLSKDEQDRLRFLQEELKARTTSAAIGGGEVTTIGKILDEIDSLTEKRKLLQDIGAGLSIEDQQRLNSLKQQVAQNDILKKAQEDRLAKQKELAKVEEQQAKLQEQQAKLQFLTGQLNLLKTIDELGLNSKEILKGIQLGLGTDQQGLIDAMSRVVDTIIGTVDDQLQIASPSKIMIGRGKQIIMGLSEGMRVAANQLNRQVQTPILSAAQARVTIPVGGGSTNNTTVNNDNRQQEFNMPISVSGTDQANINQLRNFVLRTISQGA